MAKREAADQEPRLDDLIDKELLVPVRSSSGEAHDPDSVTVEHLRHGTDETGERFIAAFTSKATFSAHGPPGSDAVRMRGRRLFEHADAAQERVVVDPGAPTQVEIASGVMPFLAAGIDPNRPDALRARRPLGDLPSLEAPDEIPEPFGREMLAALQHLPQVERAWLLRAGSLWTAGIQMRPGARLADFDAVRNLLHAVASKHLGSRQHLAVTDLRAPALRELYDAAAAPFFARQSGRGIFGRIFGG